MILSNKQITKVLIRLHSLHLCCSQTGNTGFLMSRPTYNQTYKEINIQFNMSIQMGSIRKSFNLCESISFHPLQFYGVMGLMYLFLGITWLVMLACNWRDLLRVQFWVGGVIVLGKLMELSFLVI